MKPSVSHSLTLDDVATIYDAEVAKGKPPAEAHQATRTEVHAALQLILPHPDKEDEDEDPDIHWIRQKVHSTSLWKESDRMILEAGISTSGKTGDNSNGSK